MKEKIISRNTNNLFLLENVKIKAKLSHSSADNFLNRNLEDSIQIVEKFIGTKLVKTNLILYPNKYMFSRDGIYFRKYNRNILSINSVVVYDNDNKRTLTNDQEKLSFTENYIFLKLNNLYDIDRIYADVWEGYENTNDIPPIASQCIEDIAVTKSTILNLIEQEREINLILKRLEYARD